MAFLIIGIFMGVVISHFVSSRKLNVIEQTYQQAFVEERERMENTYREKFEEAKRTLEGNPEGNTALPKSVKRIGFRMSYNNV